MKKSEFGLLYWVCLCLLCILIGYFSAITLAGYAVPGATDENQQIIAVGISFMMSVILVFLTHYAIAERIKAAKIKRGEIMGKPSRFITTYTVFIWIFILFGLYYVNQVTEQRMMEIRMMTSPDAVQTRH